MEFDHEERQREKVNDNPKTSKRDKKNTDMEHEDLSDVSDLDSTGRVSEDDGRHARKGSTRVRIKYFTHTIYRHLLLFFHIAICLLSHSKLFLVLCFHFNNKSLKNNQYSSY